MEKVLLDYYAGDEFCAGVWKSKYAIKNPGGITSTTRRSNSEDVPGEMHLRMAGELARAEAIGEKRIGDPMSENLSKMGRSFRSKSGISLGAGQIFKYFDKYKYIIPQGSIMAMLGNENAIGSLSNCFVIPSPVDSYGGIFKTDQQIAQLQKRRGGVGLNLNSLRPDGSVVTNAAGTSTGAHSFMDRYSSTTREVAQNGRRGALMLLMDCRHPDIFKFVSKKADLTKVTGANISVMLTDEFMQAVSDDEDFICCFPIDHRYQKKEGTPWDMYNYNQIYTGEIMIEKGLGKYWHMKIKAKELYEEIVKQAWGNAEPGVAFIDRIHDYSPDGVYSQFKAVASNPCGEIFMQAYDACRLLCLNLYNIVNEPFTENSAIDYDKLYEIAYIQQRLADDIVSLEIEYIDRIIAKIKHDKEPDDVKAVELDLWQNIKRVAMSSRRTGCGFTALADMLAALGLKYDSDEAIEIVGKVMKMKMMAELDCTIDLAITRGPFEGWDKRKEYPLVKEQDETWENSGNSFYKMIREEFPEQYERMKKYGRRNVSWSTVAPTGSASIISLLSKYPNTSAGIEPQFACYYFRNKKINPSDENIRVDFVDANGDSWMTSPVIMGGLKEWIDINGFKAGYLGLEHMPKEVLDELYKKSPYFNACAGDISWEKRIEMQSVVQRFTTHSISSTLNLPKNTPMNIVNDIYFKAWKSGLKGITIYRDGCRTGVLNTSAPTESASKFTYRDALKRPKEIEAKLDIVTVKGTKYAVVVGLIDSAPYEVFAFNLPDDVKVPCNGKTIKQKKGHYNFICEDGTLRNIQEAAVKKEEQTLTRLVSGMLRHGAKPEWVIDQIDKCDLEIVSFGKAISRTLAKFVEKKETGEKCPECGNSLVKQEGCVKCTGCSYSKC